MDVQRWREVSDNSEADNSDQSRKWNDSVSGGTFRDPVRVDVCAGMDSGVSGNDVSWDGKNGAESLLCHSVFPVVSAEKAKTFGVEDHRLCPDLKFTALYGRTDGESDASDCVRDQWTFADWILR